MGDLTHDAYSYTEALAIAPIYISGMSHVVVDHGNLHFCLYQEMIGADGGRERVIVLRVIMPESTWQDATKETLFEIEAAKAGAQPYPNRIFMNR